MSNTVRNDLKQLVGKIESLAKEVQSKLDNGADVLAVANELVRNNTTFVFALGELYALEQSSNKKVKGTVVSNPNNTSRVYKRDSLGRFARV